LSFYEGARVGDLKTEELEVLCTDSTALLNRVIKSRKMKRMEDVGHMEDLRGAFCAAVLF
jgi:hypothetical protein